MQTLSMPIVSMHHDAREVAIAGGLARMIGQRPQTDGVFSFVHLTLRPGYGTPAERLRLHDKAIFVLDGEARGTLGERAWSAGPGAFVWLPRGVEHTIEAAGDRSLEALLMTIPD